MFLRNPVFKLSCARSFHLCRFTNINVKQVEEYRISVPWGHVADGVIFQRVSLLRFLSIRDFHSSSSTSINAKQVEEIRIPVPWGHVAGRWWGDKNTVPTVGLHGLLDNGATFDKLAPLLETPSLLSLDLPGHGFSSHVPRGIVFHHFDYIIYLRYILKNYFNWEQLNLLGHSYGASLWFIYSSLYPDEVKKFISIDGATHTIASKENKSASFIRSVMENNIEFENKLDNPPPENTLEELIEIMYNSRNEIKLPLNKEACMTLLSRGAIRSPDTGKYYFSRDLRLNSKCLGIPVQDFIFALSKNMKCDILYVRSSYSIIFGEYLQACEKSLNLMRESSKKVESKLVEGGHHVHLEHPERMAPILNEFLNS